MCPALSPRAYEYGVRHVQTWRLDGWRTPVRGSWRVAPETRSSCRVMPMLAASLDRARLTSPLLKHEREEPDRRNYRSRRHPVEL